MTLYIKICGYVYIYIYMYIHIYIYTFSDRQRKNSLRIERIIIITTNYGKKRTIYQQFANEAAAPCGAGVFLLSLRFSPATWMARLSFAPFNMCVPPLQNGLVAMILVCPLPRNTLAVAASRASRCLNSSSEMVTGSIARNASLQDIPRVVDRTLLSIKCFNNRGRVAKSLSQTGH